MALNIIESIQTRVGRTLYKGKAVTAGELNAIKAWEYFKRSKFGTAYKAEVAFRERAGMLSKLPDEFGVRNLRLVRRKDASDKLYFKLVQDSFSIPTTYQRFGGFQRNAGNFAIAGAIMHGAAAASKSGLFLGRESITMLLFIMGMAAFMDFILEETIQTSGFGLFAVKDDAPALLQNLNSHRRMLITAMSSRPMIWWNFNAVAFSMFFNASVETYKSYLVRYVQLALKNAYTLNVKAVDEYGKELQADIYINSEFKYSKTPEKYIKVEMAEEGSDVFKVGLRLANYYDEDRLIEVKAFDALDFVREGMAPNYLFSLNYTKENVIRRVKAKDGVLSFEDVTFKPAIEYLIEGLPLSPEFINLLLDSKFEDRSYKVIPLEQEFERVYVDDDGRFIDKVYTDGNAFYKNLDYVNGEYVYSNQISSYKVSEGDLTPAIGRSIVGIIKEAFTSKGYELPLQIAVDLARYIATEAPGVAFNTLKIHIENYLRARVNLPANFPTETVDIIAYNIAVAANKSFKVGSDQTLRDTVTLENWNIGSAITKNVYPLLFMSKSETCTIPLERRKYEEKNLIQEWYFIDGIDTYTLRIEEGYEDKVRVYRGRRVHEVIPPLDIYNLIRCQMSDRVNWMDVTDKTQDEINATHWNVTNIIDLTIPMRQFDIRSDWRWSMVPGVDTERMLDFIKNNLKVDWISDDTIVEKVEDEKIKISDKEYELYITRDSLNKKLTFTGNLTKETSGTIEAVIRSGTDYIQVWEPAYVGDLTEAQIVIEGGNALIYIDGEFYGEVVNSIPLPVTLRMNFEHWIRVQAEGVDRSIKWVIYPDSPVIPGFDIHTFYLNITKEKMSPYISYRDFPFVEVSPVNALITITNTRTNEALEYKHQQPIALSKGNEYIIKVSKDGYQSFVKKFVSDGKTLPITNINLRRE